MYQIHHSLGHKIERREEEAACAQGAGSEDRIRSWPRAHPRRQTILRRRIEAPGWMIRPSSWRRRRPCAVRAVRIDHVDGVRARSKTK